MSNKIKIYENGKVVEEIAEENIDLLPDATYGGAWIGSERLLGWATTKENIRLPIATDGNETYGSYDNPSGFQEGEAKKTIEIRKLSGLDASDILTRTTLDEVPDGYRDEVFVEEENGEVLDNWFVGEKGALSYSGTELTLKQWNEKRSE